VHVKGGRTIALGIWDTAGAEQFQSLSCLYYRASRAAVICFDPCSRSSFEKLQFWVGLPACA
jgi:GTPase SAR1 family protein